MGNNRHNFNKIEQRNNTNKILVSRLDTKNIIPEQSIFNKQQQEIILLNHSLISPYNYYSQNSYLFKNFSGKYIQYIHPLILLETTSAWISKLNTIETTIRKWWEQNSETNYVFHTNISSILREKNDDYTWTYAPIYVTLKLLVWNPTLFQSIKIL